MVRSRKSPLKRRCLWLEWRWFRRNSIMKMSFIIGNWRQISQCRILTCGKSAHMLELRVFHTASQVWAGDMNARAELRVLWWRQFLLAHTAYLQCRCRATGWFDDWAALKIKWLIVAPIVFWHGGLWLRDKYSPDPYCWWVQRCECNRGVWPRSFDWRLTTLHRRFPPEPN